TKAAEAKPADTTGTQGTGTTGIGPGDDHDKGHCDQPPCGLDEEKKPEPKPEPPPPPPKKPKYVRPSDLAAIRIAGETQIQPSEITKMQIIRAGHRGTVEAFLTAIDDRGAVTAGGMRRSTG